jgi:hypothetical protein
MSRPNIDLVIEMYRKAKGEFCKKMSQRLDEKSTKGYNGWDDPSRTIEFRERAVKAINEGRYVDAANFVLFLWYNTSNIAIKRRK